jgi:hypothetical protein
MMSINVAPLLLLLMSTGIASSTTEIPPVSVGISESHITRRDVGRNRGRDQSNIPDFVRRRDRRRNQLFAAWDRTATPTASINYNAGGSYSEHIARSAEATTTTTDEPVVRFIAPKIRSRM